MSHQSLDLDTLRSLVLVAQHGSHARAAEILGRSPSAVSLQLKRLQDLIGVPLFRKRGRNVVLTGQGELAVHHARRVLSSNNEMIDALRGTRARGRLRIGIGSDFIELVLPVILKHVHTAYPDLELEIKVERNAALQRQFDAGELDLVLTLGPARPDQLASVPLRWFHLPAFSLPANKPLPLAVFSAPCHFRESALRALESAGRSWRIVLESPSLRGLEIAVASGMGITVRAENSFASDLLRVHPELPDLPELGVFLQKRKGAKQAFVHRTAQVIETAAREAFSAKLPDQQHQRALSARRDPSQHSGR